MLRFYQDSIRSMFIPISFYFIIIWHYFHCLQLNLIKTGLFRTKWPGIDQNDSSHKIFQNYDIKLKLIGIQLEYKNFEKYLQNCPAISIFGEVSAFCPKKMKNKDNFQICISFKQKSDWECLMQFLKHLMFSFLYTYWIW